MATIILYRYEYDLVCSRTNIGGFFIPIKSRVITLGPFADDARITARAIICFLRVMAERIPMESLVQFHFNELLEIGYRYECPLVLKFVCTYKLRYQNSPYIYDSLMRHSYFYLANAILPYILCLRIYCIHVQYPVYRICVQYIRGHPYKRKRKTKRRSKMRNLVRGMKRMSIDCKYSKSQLQGIPALTSAMKRLILDCKFSKTHFSEDSCIAHAMKHLTLESKLSKRQLRKGHFLIQAMRNMALH